MIEILKNIRYINRYILERTTAATIDSVEKSIYIATYMAPLLSNIIDATTSTYLGKEIMKLNSGDIFVIDIAMLSSLEEQQSFVIGHILNTIDELLCCTNRYLSGKQPQKLDCLN